MKRVEVFFILVIYYFLFASGHLDYPIESFSRDVTLTQQDHDLSYDFSNKINSFYYAFCWQKTRSTSGNVEYFHNCNVTEEIPIANGVNSVKTCYLQYKTVGAYNEKSTRTLKSWGDHRMLLLDFNSDSLWIHQINMTTCEYKMFPIRDVKLFQVYAIDDNEFNVFWSSNNPEFTQYIMRNTYNISSLKSKNQKFGPESENWKVLSVGKTSYYQEKRIENYTAVEVIVKVDSTSNATDFMKIKVDYERLITSNLYGEFGYCLISLVEPMKCGRSDQDGKPKFNFTLTHDHFVRDHDSKHAKLHNLKNGSFMIVFVDYADEFALKQMSLTLVIAHPNGHYDYPLKVELEKSELTCSKENEVTEENKISPLVNVVEQPEKFCFQFVCPDEYHFNKTLLLPILKFRMKCISKSLFGFKTFSGSSVTPKLEPNGVQANSGSSVFITFIVPLLVIKVVV